MNFSVLSFSPDVTYPCVIRCAASGYAPRYFGIGKRLNIKNRFFYYFVLITLGVCYTACASQKLKTTVLNIVREDSVPVEITVEIAKTDEERSAGLMHRKKLADGEGMIFIFEHDQQLSFWMKNTLIPLSVAFIRSDGLITEIRDMQPLDLSSIISSRPVRYALEAPQGWFDRSGIKAGDRVINEELGIRK